ncbi:MAG: hypothetical protein QXN23_01705 [Candidatus Caldarchaeum sp.]
MREVSYVLDGQRDRQYVALKAFIQDRFGVQKIPLTRLRGWRGELVLRHLKLENESSDYEAALVFIGMKVVRFSRSREEALKFLNRVRELSRLELHFWASKFLLDDKKAFRAWRALYG